MTRSPKCLETWSAPSHTLNSLNEDVSSEYDQYEYAVLILSAPLHHNRRDSIRNSWMKLADNLKGDGGDSGQWKNNNMERLKTRKLQIRFIFVVGLGDLTQYDKERLVTESKMEGDMLLFDKFFDSYKSLTSKMLLSLIWISKNMKRLKYLIKCDDDSFLRIDHIVHNLEEYAPAMNAREISRHVSLQVNKYCRFIPRLF